MKVYRNTFHRRLLFSSRKQLVPSHIVEPIKCYTLWDKLLLLIRSGFSE